MFECMPRTKHQAWGAHQIWPSRGTRSTRSMLDEGYTKASVSLSVLLQCTCIAMVYNDEFFEISSNAYNKLL